MSPGAHAAEPTVTDCLHANAAAARFRNTHKLRAAREQLVVCASATCPNDIKAECSQRVADVNAAIPTMVFEVKDPAGNDLTTVSITMDGKSLVERFDGAALELDPGTHAFTFQTPGQPTVSKTFVILEGQKDRRERVVVGTAPPPRVAVAPPPATAPAASAPPDAAIDEGVPPAQPPTPTPTDDSPAPWVRNGTLTALGIVTSGAGVVGLALGTVFGVEALSKKNDAGCDTNSVCPNGSAADTLRGSRTAGNFSTAFFIAGGVLEAAGITMWIVGKNNEVQTSAQVGLGGPGVQLSGAWR